MKTNQPQWSIGECTISYKPEKKSMLGQIRCAREAVEYLQPMYEEELNHVEKFMIIHLSRSNRIIGHSTISIGGVAGTVVDAKVVFQKLLKTNASAFIACHNHPSGNTNPSQSDIDITKRMKEAGDMLELPLIDHIILAENENGQVFYSFADEGRI